MKSATAPAKSCFSVILLLSVFSTTFSQTPKELKLSAAGLSNEAFIQKIFEGDFLNIPFGRENMKFAILFNAYLNAYARQCDSSLPPDKIELKRRECAKESVTKNGLGVEISRVCVEWVMVSTGLYASPEMYNAKLIVERLHAGDALYNTAAILKDPVGNAMSLNEAEKIDKADMTALVQMNGCNSPALKRFQENLMLFALNRAPVRADDPGAGKPGRVSASVAQDMGKLAEDLIFEHSKKWLMNKYQRGSASNVVVTSKDNQGRPSEVRANYTYQGVSGKSEGSVRITFNEEGLPECLYFFDFPTTCRTADRQIVIEYANGRYQTK